jgi:hypothetical protein
MEWEEARMAAPQDLEHYRQRFAYRGASPRIGSTWRYYATLAGE